MTKYLISFDDDAMKFTEEVFVEVGRDTHAVVQEAKDAGVWVFGGGIEYYQAKGSVVAPDGSVADFTYPPPQDRIGGMCIVNVATREEALIWAAKMAAACRVQQTVREFMDDPES